MISKKAQQEVIVTVLLVLIALAAVALVATFVMKNVKQGTEGSDQKQACIKVELDITKAAGTTVTIKRTGDDTALEAVNVYVEGVKVNSTTNIASGATADVTVPALTAGKKVEVAGVLTGGYACATAAEATVA